MLMEQTIAVIENLFLFIHLNKTKKKPLLSPV